MPVRRWHPWALLAALVCACGSSELSVGGDTGYVRCYAAEPAPARQWRRGNLRLSRTDRELRIEGAPSEWRLAIFAGEGGSLPAEDLRSTHADVIALVGGLGDTAAIARANLRLLESLGPPVLFVAGGRDERAVFTEVIGSDRDGIIDASALRSIAIGPITLVPVSGAPEGRYARSPRACGLARADVELWPSHEASPARYLLSWSAPTPTPALLGVEGGSDLVRSIGSRTGAAHAIFAWPVEAGGELHATPSPWILEAGASGLRRAATP